MTCAAFWASAMFLPPLQALRFQSQAGKLEARETGDVLEGSWERERREVACVAGARKSSASRLGLLERGRERGKLGVRETCGARHHVMCAPNLDFSFLVPATQAIVKVEGCFSNP